MYKHRFNAKFHTVSLSMKKTNQSMFNDRMGVNSQNRRQKTVVWQNSEFVNVQWCGKCAYLILVSGRLNNNTATNGGKKQQHYQRQHGKNIGSNVLLCRHDSYRIISEGRLACSDNSTVVPCYYSCLCHTVFHVLCLCL